MVPLEPKQSMHPATSGESVSPTGTPRTHPLSVPRFLVSHFLSLCPRGVTALDPVGSTMLRYWGTRGSVPTPGAETVRYGGNTSCVEILAGGRRLILDAGTGIMGLGKSIAAHGHPKGTSPAEATLFLTHFHWDHIQGLPFFAPAYDQNFRLHIVAPGRDDAEVESTIRRVMGPVYFPLPWEALQCALTFESLTEGPWTDGDLTVQTARMRHNDYTLGYRIETPGACIVFIPDNELVGGNYPTPPSWRQEIQSLVAKADLLIHDGMFTEDEYAGRTGWGHSTFNQCLDLALDGGVKRLHFFHHSPERSDDELDVILDRMRKAALARSSDLVVEAAAEGRVITLG